MTAFIFLLCSRNTHLFRLKQIKEPATLLHPPYLSVSFFLFFCFENGCLFLSLLIQAGRFGQLTYMRVYQGKFQKGNYLYNSRTGKRVRISRLVQMHADKMEVGPTSICEIHNYCQFPTDLENVISPNNLSEFLQRIWSPE